LSFEQPLTIGPTEAGLDVRASPCRGAFLERAAIRLYELVDGGACRVRAVALRRTNVEPAAGG